ncbi:MAG: polymer-forming cytoskeletal protein [Mobilitalea sp.]
MGFFKDFKEDLSQAVNELLPDDESAKKDTLVEEDSESEEQMVNTLDLNDISTDEESDNEKMKEWLEEFAQDEDSLEDSFDYKLDEEEALENVIENEEDLEGLIENEEEEEEDMDDNIDLELLEAMIENEEEAVVEEKEKVAPKVRTTSLVSDDEVTVISKGTSINGSISSDGSLDIMGNVTGDVECLGKLSITGKIIGNSSAAEVYVNTERLEGSITSEGTVKVGLGTVIIGDILATSGVIAGAVKGEIDINGPIVVDSTAIIKGNIKAKSVQINNGAVIEGFCSLSYSEVDVDNIFE